MAAAPTPKAQSCNVEYEENITCPVCLTRFDDLGRKPKYLVACCHTVCRSCLDTISQSGILKRILCPICRSLTSCPGGVDRLPTNGDKLFLLKMEKNCQEKDENEALDWCFTCQKKTSATCSNEKHSIIVMNPQLLNTEINLNMASISAGLKTYGEATIRHRQEIGTRLDTLGRWLDSYRNMIDEFQKANQSRIGQIKGMLQGTNLTVSVQKLMQLSINAEQNLGLLKDGQQEEAHTNKLLQELRSVEQVSEVLGPARKSPFVTLPYLPNLRKELDYEKYFPVNGHPLWAGYFLDTLAPTNSNSPTFTFGSSPGSLPQRASLFRMPSPFPPSTTHPFTLNLSANAIPSPAVEAGVEAWLGVRNQRPVHNTGGSSSSNTTTPSPIAHREIIAVRRRRSQI